MKTAPYNYVYFTCYIIDVQPQNGYFRVKPISITQNKAITDGITIEDLQICAPFSKPPSYVTVQGRTCEQIVKYKIVIASGISSNHFKEVRDMIASVQHFYPSLHIIIYNLGLTNFEVNTLESYCNVLVRPFNFSKYPEFVHQNLRFYSWKPLMIYELSKEFEFIFYYDASIRLLKPVVDIVLPLMKDFPFIPGKVLKNAGGNSIARLTHGGMLRYLNITQSREELDGFGSLGAGLWALRVNKLTVSKILEPWADCALHKECIAPEGAGLICNEFKNDSKVAYRGCHRYDMSALDLILVREFGLNVWDSFHVKETEGVFAIERHPTEHYVVNIC